MREAAIIENNSMPVTESGCWWWLGALTEKGYGIAALAGSHVRAHRLSWLLHRGPIPNGILVCHHCDTPCCVNPDHLFLGTHQDNVRDMDMKGRRHFHDPPAPKFKLTHEQLQEIAASRESNRVLGQRYRVGKSTIGDVRRRLSEFVYGGTASCVQGTGNCPQAPPQSADTSRHQRTELSKGPSDLSLGSSGRTTQRHSSPQSCAETCEPRDDGSPARSMRQPTYGPSCSPSPQIQTGQCGND